ncbi:glycosyltransferase [Cobetia sp. cqz5-12]|uniref:glycosyltransferase family 2 protein n=1 Tax=Cobetia sp. cqz5-12 TaxID=2609415 RepID=UPI00190437C2|nr:glycosyltransferase family 2 protein [Cobetia sp. cqz5-12]QQK64575.1 glycosyltransferase [Cobetia sp. cqz5-12]
MSSPDSSHAVTFYPSWKKALPIPSFLEGSQLQSSTAKAPTFLSLPLHIRVPRYLRIDRDLEPLEEGEWRSLSSTSAFFWEGPKPIPGWNMVEIDMERSITGAAAVITFQTDTRIHTVELPLRAGKITRRMLRVPRGVRRITLCPINGRGTFRLKHFRLVWLTPTFARDRLIQRLVTAHRHFRGLPKQQVTRAIKQEVQQTGERWSVVALRHYDSTFISLCSKHNYQQWIDMVESLGQGLVNAKVADHIAPVITSGMVFSLGMIVNEDIGREAFGDSLTSLIAQTHRRWQLVVSASDTALKKHDWLAACCASDERITLLAEPEQATGRFTDPLAAISRAAVGDWVGLMTTGATLSADALTCFARLMKEKPQAGFLYCDEDRIDGDGHRHSPNFKPGWNPDLLLSTPYLGHLGLWSREQWQACRGFLETEDILTATTTDLIHLLALEMIASTRMSHQSLIWRVPQVLVHVPERHLLPTKTCPEDTGTRHLARVGDYLTRHAVTAVAEPGKVLKEANDGTGENVRVRWRLPESQPLVSLLVPTRDGVEILKPCVDAILAQTEYRHFELLILDNQSCCPRTLEYMRDVARRDERVRVLRWDAPFNYSAINNFGAREARGDIIGLVNNDIEPMNGEWLTEMVSQVCRPDIGCVGAKLYYPNGTIQHAGVILGLGSIAGHAHRFFHREEDGFQGRLKSIQNLSAVTAACLLLRRSVFEEVNGLNEQHLAVAYNDVDLCLKVREAGYRNLWTPYAELYHHESISRGADDTPRKRARWLSECDYMRTTWAEQLDNDPAYNPNLTLVHEDFSLR